VGRASNAKKFPYAKTVVLMAAVAYLVIGLLIQIGIKLFSSNAKAYQFTRVVLKWPLAFFKIFSVLKTQKKSGNIHGYSI
jgi:uncharacterized protein YhhL (DUF1145 family)